MTLILSGTDGLSDVDGSAATPAIRGTDANTGIFFPAADTVGVSTGGSERVRVDSSGNVGIGTSSPGAKLGVGGGAGNAKIKLSNTASGSGSGDGFDLDFTGTDIYITNRENGFMAFENNGAERCRIDSSGNLLVGATSQIGSEKLGVTSGTTNATQYTTIATKGGSGLYVNQQQTTSVSTSAAVILASPNYCTFCLVHGSDGTNRFSDVVLMSVGTGTINVISSLTASGTPAARTYSQSSSTFKLAMASGTYTVQVSALTMNS